MRNIKFCLHKEPPYYVAQCLNAEVSSFGETVEEAIANLKEAAELYFEDAPAGAWQPVEEVLLGEALIHA